MVLVIGEHWLPKQKKWYPKHQNFALGFPQIRHDPWGDMIVIVVVVSLFCSFDIAAVYSFEFKWTGARVQLFLRDRIEVSSVDLFDSSRFVSCSYMSAILQLLLLLPLWFFFFFFFFLVFVLVLLLLLLMMTVTMMMIHTTKTKFTVDQRWLMLVVLVVTP